MRENLRMTEKYAAKNHRMVELVRWDPTDSAQRIADRIFMSRGISYSYLIADQRGDVVINTGMPEEGPRHRERFEQALGRPIAPKVIVITQSHPDHYGGWPAFVGADTITVCQRDFEWCAKEKVRLGRFYARRLHRVLASLTSKEQRATWNKGVEPVVSPIYFAESYRFRVGSTDYEVHSTPSGETIDSAVVWLPGERTLFTGNLMGALQGSLPHFYTLRGDRDRSLVRFTQDMDKLLALRPITVITGHGEPIRGEERVQRYLQQLRDATQFIWNETLDGMCDGKDLFTLMSQIKLPSKLAHEPGRGPVSWYVRAAWEEVTGWFRQESTTELYAVPPSAIWADLVELAGADALVARARDHVDAGRSLHALHFTDVVRRITPHHAGALEVEIAALDKLIIAGRGELLDEQGWLESERERAQQELSAARSLASPETST